MTSDTHQDIALGVVLAWRDGALDVLIARRGAEQVLGGFWEFPGGKRRADESLRDCVVREVKEEVDLNVEPVEALSVIEHRYEHATVRLAPYLCRWLGGEPRAVETEQVRWVRVEDLGGYAFPPANDAMLAGVRSRVQKMGDSARDFIIPARPTLGLASDSDGDT